MTQKLVFSVVESPRHPHASEVYRRLGYEELRFDSQRKAIAALRSHAPALVVADFIYGFSTYYQATNVSNLDVLLHSLAKYAPDAQVIVLVDKAEREHVEKLRAIRPLLAVFEYPVSEEAIGAALLA